MGFPIVDLFGDDLSKAAVAREIGVTRQTVHDMRKTIQIYAGEKYGIREVHVNTAGECGQLSCVLCVGCIRNTQWLRRYV